ncbi:MAG: sulfite exporter TauE/SafE family protein [Candidatus Acidiferrales bacterium]|jgi:uncharacterized membrane protein YfcA
MNSVHLIHPLYSLSGFIVGLLVGLTGVGGGSLMTPLLVILFGIPATTAVGTDLLYACITKSVGTAVHGFSGTVDWPIVGKLAAGSVPATVLTLLILSRHQGQLDRSSNTITSVLGVALICTAISIVFRKWILDTFASVAGKLNSRGRTFFTVLSGIVLGILVSLSSVGAGAIGVTFLLILYPKMPAGKLVGSDIAHAVPLTLIAGIGHWFLGSIDGLLLLSLLVGSVPGIIVGSYISSRVPDKLLRPVLAGTLAAVGAKLSL